MTLEWKVASINTGLPKPLQHGDKTIVSGIFKTAREGAVRFGETGPDGDGQGDLVHHGGSDKAVCVYFHTHYPYWQDKLETELPYGAFGENVTLDCGTEEDLLIGDILQAGSLVVQVSQPRQPCFKLGLRHGVGELPLWFQTSGRTGFYLRVLKEGMLEAGDELILTERPAHGMTLAEANVIFYEKRSDAEATRRLLEIPELSQSWKSTLLARLEKLTL